MSQKCSALIGVFTIFFSASLLLSLSGCGHDQELIAITVQPPIETFGAPNIPVSADAGLNVNLRAYGSYIHPPVTKEISGQVTWSSNTPQMVTVDAAGTITATGNACGNTLVSATMAASHGGIQVGFMTATVVCFTGAGPTGPSLIVNFAGGRGTVISSPAGIACSQTCGFIFNTGASVMLTASPTAPSTSATWTAGCDTISGNTCTVTMSMNRTVTVQFQ
jgi:Bacterial Ig-like domain (group 2)